MFSISPDPFVGQVNRATAETSHSRAINEGLAPLMRFVRSFMNRLIACEFGSPDLDINDHAQDFGIDPAEPNAAESYTKMANKLFQRMDSEKLPSFEYPNGGEIAVYDPSTNSFGVYNSNGMTQTFYKPTSSTYFEREMESAVDRGGNIINALPQTAATTETSSSVNLGGVIESQQLIEGSGGGPLDEFHIAHPHDFMDDDEPKL